MKDEYKTILISGGLAGILCIMFFLIFYLAGVPIFDPILKMDVWIPILAIFFSIYYYRNGIGENGLKFFQGIWMGLMVNLVVILLVTSCLYLLLEIIDPTYFQESIQALELQIQQAIESKKILKVSIEELKTYKEQMKNQSSISLITDKGIRYALFGLPATLVFSVLFRK